MKAGGGECGIKIQVLDVGGGIGSTKHEPPRDWVPFVVEALLRIGQACEAYKYECDGGVIHPVIRYKSNEQRMKGINVEN